MAILTRPMLETQAPILSHAPILSYAQANMALSHPPKKKMFTKSDDSSSLTHLPYYTQKLGTSVDNKEDQRSEGAFDASPSCRRGEGRQGPSTLRAPLYADLLREKIAFLGPLRSKLVRHWFPRLVSLQLMKSSGEDFPCDSQFIIANK